MRCGKPGGKYGQLGLILAGQASDGAVRRRRLEPGGSLACVDVVRCAMDHCTLIFCCVSAVFSVC